VESGVINAFTDHFSREWGIKPIGSFGDLMKRISVMTLVLFSLSLAQSGAAQSTPQTVPTATSKDQAKQDKQTAKAKAKATKNDSKAQSGKKTTTSQDAAYALAYRTGTAETSKPSPK
jgi:hypothetical protein